mmetsp:Transcript_49505/g.92240  ORF Transcript_49505/g.92240 Transcript_49505/m.92240 type:complete len:310 (-) Transcript_49505:190-1119(-)
MADKTAQMAALGMEGMVAELTSGRAKMAEKYSEAYQDARAILCSMSELRKESAAFLDGLPEDTRNQAALQESQTSLEECLVGAEAMQRQLDLMDPPPALSPNPPAPSVSPLPLHQHQASFVEAPSNTVSVHALPELATAPLTTAGVDDSTELEASSPTPALHSSPAMTEAPTAETASADQSVADQQPSQVEAMEPSEALVEHDVPLLDATLHESNQPDTTRNDDTLKDGDVEGSEATISTDALESVQPKTEPAAKLKKTKKKTAKSKSGVATSESESSHVAASLKAPPPPPPRTVPPPEDDDDFFNNLS